VVSFNREKHALSKLDTIAEETRVSSTKGGNSRGIMMGGFLSVMFGFFFYTYALGWAFIATKVPNRSTGKMYDVYDIVTISQSTVMALMVFGQILPLFPSIVKALVCGK